MYPNIDWLVEVCYNSFQIWQQQYIILVDFKQNQVQNCGRHLNEFYFILNGLSLHVSLINCDRPRVMWAKLNLLYGYSSEDAKQSAWQKFYDFRIMEGKSVTTQIETFDNLEVETSGEKLYDTAVMSKLLGSLPSRFSNFTMAWECTLQAERKKDYLIVRNIREEKRNKICPL